MEESKNTCAMSTTLGPSLPACMSEFELEAELGSGSQGSVFRASLKKNPDIKYAVKKCFFNLKNQADQVSLKRLITEYSTMAKFNSPYIIKTFGLRKGEINQSSGQEYFLILEYCSGGDLQHYINHLPNGMPEKQVKMIFFDIVRGLLEMLARGVYHRDLKPENVLLYPDHQHAMVADLGCIFDATRGNLMSVSGVGSPFTKAPECLNYEDGAPQRFNHKTDVWSLGVTVYLMLYKMANPDPWKKTSVKPHERSWHALDFPSEVEVSAPLKNLITNMLTKEWRSRPSLVELLEDPYFDDIRSKLEMTKSWLSRLVPILTVHKSLEVSTSAAWICAEATQNRPALRQ